MTWKETLQRWLVPQLAGGRRPPTIAPGLYHFLRERDGQYLRFHLRVDRGGQGLLIAAAAEAVRLAPAAVVAAHRLLAGGRTEEVAAGLGVPAAHRIVTEVARAIEALGRPNARYPILHLLEPEGHANSGQLLAPFQADVVPGDAGSLRQVLDRLWEAGIPHVRLRCVSDPDLSLLVDAVEHAEDLGLITGLRVPRATGVSQEAVDQLAAVGLDYVVLPWAVTESLHDSLHGAGDFVHVGRVVQAVRSREMTPVLEIPLVDETWEAWDEAPAEITSLGIAHVEVFAVGQKHAADAAGSASSPAAKPAGLHALTAPALRQAAAWLEDWAEASGVCASWLPPQRSPAARSVADVARRGPRTGGDVSIRVAADGSIVPARGPCTPVGNLLQQPWETVWQHPAFDRYRRRLENPVRCDHCPGLAICAVDCPADPGLWAEEE